MKYLYHRENSVIRRLDRRIQSNEALKLNCLHTQYGTLSLWITRSSRVMTLLLCLLSVKAMALTASQDLLQRLNATHSMTADFVQTPLGQANDLQQTSTGRMQIVRPNKFRWQITKPTQQLIVTDGKTLWYYNIDLLQVTEQALSQQIHSTPAQLLSGATAKVLAQFTITRQQHSDATEFNLQAKNNQQQFKQVSLRFADQQLQVMTIHDNLGQASRIRFSHVRHNVSIDPKQFTFTPPTDADVIRK